MHIALVLVVGGACASAEGFWARLAGRAASQQAEDSDAVSAARVWLADTTALASSVVSILPVSAGKSVGHSKSKSSGKIASHNDQMKHTGIDAAVNGYAVQSAQMKSTDDFSFDVPLDGGWTRFFFGAAGTTTACRVRAPEGQGRFVRIAIADAYCPGDAFDVVQLDDAHCKGHAYLFSTPRVPAPANPQCTKDDPDVTRKDDAYSSTQFMLPGKVDIAVAVRDSPYGGGAAFIRADTLATGCAYRNLLVVTAPHATHADAERTCAALGRVPLHVRPENASVAAQALATCAPSGTLAWTGRISLAAGVSSAACVAFDASNAADPTVAAVACDTPLVVICA